MNTLRVPTDDSTSESATERFADAVTDSGLGWTDFAIAGGIFLGGIAVAFVIKALVARLLHRGHRVDPALAALIARLIGYVVMIVGFVYALEYLGIPIGLAVGGLGIATVFTLFLTPVAFSVLAGLSKPRASEAARLDTELAAWRQ